MPIKAIAGAYPMMLSAALCALVPYLLLTTAHALFTRQLVEDLDTTRTLMSVITGLAVAGYCFGAFLAGDLVHRIRQRTLFLVFEGIFVLCALAGAFAQSFPVFAAAHVLMGLMTGFLLVVALPPVIQTFPASRLPLTSVFVNMGFFGAIAAGPIIGGYAGEAHAWRQLYMALAGVGALGWLIALVSTPVKPPKDPDLPVDAAALGLALFAVVLPFWGTAELAGHGLRSPLFWGPMAGGIVCMAGLLIVEYVKERPLAPVSRMLSTYPTVGILVAMAGGGVLVTLLELAILYRSEVLGAGPLATGLSFWPMLPGAVIASALVGVVIRTRYMPVLVLFGLTVLVLAGALQLARGDDPGSPVALAAAALLGIGAGATVTPAMFMAGFTVPAQIIGRVFALIELIRTFADFILSPVMMKAAHMASGAQGQETGAPAATAGGVALAVWITIGMTILGIATVATIFLAGTRTLLQPDLKAWLDDGGQAIDSPPLGARLRRRGRVAAGG